MSDTLRPYGLSPPGFSVLGILQVRILEWVAPALLQGIFPTQVSCIAGGFFPLNHGRKPLLPDRDTACFLSHNRKSASTLSEYLPANRGSVTLQRIVSCCSGTLDHLWPRQPRELLGHPVGWNHTASKESETHSWNRAPLPRLSFLEYPRSTLGYLLKFSLYLHIYSPFLAWQFFILYFPCLNHCDFYLVFGLKLL